MRQTKIYNIAINLTGHCSTELEGLSASYLEDQVFLLRSTS